MTVLDRIPSRETTCETECEGWPKRVTFLGATEGRLAVRIRLIDGTEETRPQVAFLESYWWQDSKGEYVLPNGFEARFTVEQGTLWAERGEVPPPSDRIQARVELTAPGGERRFIRGDSVHLREIPDRRATWEDEQRVLLLGRARQRALGARTA